MDELDRAKDEKLNVNLVLTINPTLSRLIKAEADGLEERSKSFVVRKALEMYFRAKNQPSISPRSSYFRAKNLPRSSGLGPQKP